MSVTLCSSLQQRVKAASSSEQLKVLAVDSSNADFHFQQLDKLRVVYEEYVKTGKELIPLAEKNLYELNEELDLKNQALDDVGVNCSISSFNCLLLFVIMHSSFSFYVAFENPLRYPMGTLSPPGILRPNLNGFG